jgi:hypothetical protein
LVLPFVGKPVHIDDANFLVLARGAALDPWRPHALEINWQGTTQRAFEVLSNPPGIGWWLAPVHDASVWLQHLWMLPWLALALFGAWRLGRALAGNGLGGLLLLGTAPVAVLGAQALTPDLPLYACTLAGLGGLLTAKRHGWAWALLAGCAALFRYSGLCVIPLALLIGWQRKRLVHSLAVFAAPIALALHDLHAYGQIHLVAMTGFQSVSNTPRLVARKGLAALAMLGGAGAIPVLARGRSGVTGAALGAVAGVGAAWLSDQGLGPAAMTIAACAAGGAALSGTRLRTREDVLLACWAWGGVVFLLTLRFTAARYWLPFLPGVALALLRGASAKRMWAAAGLQAGLALLLSIDDAKLARAHADAAAWAGPGPGTFAGHWGWQHHLEAAGWTALEDEGDIGAVHVVARYPWPQEPAEGTCMTEVERWSAPDRWPGPRVHTAVGGANLHAFVIASGPAGDPDHPVETYAPWSFGSEPYEEVVRWIPCPE